MFTSYNRHMDDEGTMDLNFDTDESEKNPMILLIKNISRRSDEIHPKSNGR